MKAIKAITLTVGILLAATTVSNAGSWGISINTGNAGVVYSSGGYTTQHCQQRVVYTQQCREYVNPYMPTVYGPREYYINGQPYMVTPRVTYMGR